MRRKAYRDEFSLDLESPGLGRFKRGRKPVARKLRLAKKGKRKKLRLGFKLKKETKAGREKREKETLKRRQKIKSLFGRLKKKKSIYQ